MQSSILAGAVSRGMESDKYHYIQAPEPELYDVQKDPAELNNLARSLPDVAQSLQIKLAHIGVAAKGAQQPLDEETKEKLESLGYVSSYLSPPSHSQQINPKDKMPVLHKILAAITVFIKGNYLSASQQFQSILAVQKQTPLLYDYLGLCYMRMERYADAQETFMKML